MEFDFGISTEINFLQEFLPPYKADFKHKIFRFNTYTLTPSNLFPPSNDIAYYSIMDETTGQGDIATLGVIWHKTHKHIYTQAKVIVLRGDAELLIYVCQALIDRLKIERKEEYGIGIL